VESHEIQPRNLPGKIHAWLLSVLMSFGCLLVCSALYRSTAIFGDLFKGLGVELPLATKFLIASYSWLYPLFFGAVVILLIAKEFFLHGIRRRLVATGIIFFAVISSLELVHYVLYLPLLDLVQRLSQTK
jgi:uncharacterized membrane protein